MLDELITFAQENPSVYFVLLQLVCIVYMLYELYRLLDDRGWLDAIKERLKKMFGIVFQWANNIGGLIAMGVTSVIFFWSWRDRQCLPLSVTIQKLEDAKFLYEAEHFIPLKISFFNPNPFSLFISEIALKEQGLLAGGYQAYDSTTREVIWDKDSPQALQCTLTVPPAYMTGGKPLQTNTVDCPDMFFIDKNTVGDDKKQLKFQIKYHKTLSRRHKRKLKILSSAISYAPTLYPYENRTFLEKDHGEQ